MATTIAAVSLSSNNNNSHPNSHHVAAAAAATAATTTDEISSQQSSSSRSLLEKQLTTGFFSDTSTSGHMFDIKATAGPIRIHGIDINTATAGPLPPINIYTKVGSYEGSERNINDWILWHSTNNTGAVTNGPDTPTSISIPSIELNEGDKRAFSVDCAAAGGEQCLRYNSNAQTQLRYKDEYMILYGTGRTNENVDALFSGALTYEAITQNPTRMPTTGTPSFSPTTSNPTLRPSSSPTTQSPSLSPSMKPTESPVSIKTITTKFDSTVSYAGVMWDIQARDHLVITSLAFDTNEVGYIKVQLYGREGSYVGHVDSLAGWTKLADVTVKGQGLDNPTYLPEGSFDPVHVPDKEFHSFYLTSDGPNVRASKGVNENVEEDDAPERFTWNSDIIIHEGVGKRYPIENGTFAPRVWNGLFDYYTTTAAPTLSPTPMPTSRDFRLRLYWQRGYYWQESSREMYWCMQCGGSCSDGDMVYVEWCGKSDRQIWHTVGETIRPARNENLCLTESGSNSENNPLRLRPCKTNRSFEPNNQEWSGFDHAAKFQLHPKADSDKCLTQQHHPKSGERVFPQTCRTAWHHKTDMWEVY